MGNTFLIYLHVAHTQFPKPAKEDGFIHNKYSSIPVYLEYEYSGFYSLAISHLRYNFTILYLVNIS